MAAIKTIPEQRKEEVNVGAFFHRVFRLLPAFAVIALVGCGIGMLSRVPSSRLAAVVAVPVIVTFLLSRIAVLLIPHLEGDAEYDKALSQQIDLADVSACFLLVSALVAVVAILSSGSYESIGLRISAAKALQIATCGASVAVISFFALCLALKAYAHNPVVAKTVAKKEVAVFWTVLRSPGVLAMCLLGEYGVFHRR